MPDTLADIAMVLLYVCPAFLFLALAAWIAERHDRRR